MSKLAAHTSGPWKVYHALLRQQFPGNKIIEIQDDHGHAVVQWAGFDNSDRLKKTHLANARLIAAAPDMLQALRAADEVISRLQLTKDEAAAIALIERAIAKAEGRPLTSAKQSGEA